MDTPTNAKRQEPDSTPSPNPTSGKQVNNNPSPLSDPNMQACTQAMFTLYGDELDAQRNTASNYVAPPSPSLSTFRTQQHPLSEASAATEFTTEDRELSSENTWPPWVTDLKTHLTAHIMMQFTSLERTLTEHNRSTTVKLDELTASIGDMKSTVDVVTKRVREIETELKSMSNIPPRIDDLQRSVSFISDEYDTLRSDFSSQQSHLQEMRSFVTNTGKEIEGVKDRLVAAEERSMRDNLLFFSIPEKEHENAESVLQDFIAQKLPSLKTAKPIRFELVHRFGNHKKSNSSPRPIVAKFSSYKDREAVRHSAKDLKNTNFGLREQYPWEIVQKRRALQPKLQEARKQKLQASLHRDTLRVQDREYKVDKSGRVYQTDRKLNFVPRGDRERDTHT